MILWILPRCPHYRRTNCMGYKLLPRVCLSNCGKSFHPKTSSSLNGLDVASGLGRDVEVKCFHPTDISGYLLGLSKGLSKLHLCSPASVSSLHICGSLMGNFIPNPIIESVFRKPNLHAIG